MKVSYSKSCVIRSICKYCKSEPTNYYYIGKKYFTPTLRDKRQQKFCDSFSPQYHKTVDPSFFKKISEFSFSTRFYKTGTLYYRYNKPYKNQRFLKKGTQILCVLTCACTKTTWAIDGDVELA